VHEVELARLSQLLEARAQELEETRARQSQLFSEHLTLKRKLDEREDVLRGTQQELQQTRVLNQATEERASSLRQSLSQSETTVAELRRATDKL
jgi:hypothetical protein